MLTSVRSTASRRALLFGALALCGLLTLLVARDAPAAALAAAAIVATLAVAACVTVVARASVPVAITAPLVSDERRLRGAFRRQSAPDTPGCPRRPRAPGRTVTA